MRLLLWAVIIATVAFALFGQAGAVTTGAAAWDTGNSTMLTGTGCTGSVCWFRYGLISGKYPWKSLNVSHTGGVFNCEIIGLPLVSGTTVYYKAYDANGDVGAEKSVTLDAVATFAEPTFGQHLQNITDNRYDVVAITREIFGPYFDTIPMAVFTTLMMFFFFVGIVIRGKSVFYAFLLFAIVSVVVIGGGFTGALVLSPEAFRMAQVVAALSIAGAFYVLIRR